MDGAGAGAGAGSGVAWTVTGAGGRGVGAGAAATGPGTGTAVFDGATSLLPDGPPETLGCRLGTSLGGRVDGALQLSQSDAAGEEVEDEGVLEPVVVVVVVGSCFIANLSRLLRVRPGCFG